MRKRAKILCAFFALLLILCLLPIAALAEPDEPESTSPVEEAAELAPVEEGITLPEEGENTLSEEEESMPVTVCEGETCYAEEGLVVFNNGGTVYNNGATVYNNAGLVFNNAGIVYNNAGTVYANGGTVYDNAGTVFNNGAEVFSHGGSVANSVREGYYRVILGGDYDAFVEIGGLEDEDGTLLISADALCTITPREGYCITAISASAGTLTEKDGSYILSEVSADTTLELLVKLDAPVFSLESGTYAEAKTLELSAAEGAEIYYTTDGTEPGANDSSVLYTDPIPVDKGMTVCAAAIISGAESSDAVKATYAVPGLTGPVFDDVEAGYVQPSFRAIVVENSGSTVAQITGVALGGEDAACFILNRTSGGFISAGTTDSSSWQVRPAPALPAGTYTATVEFSYSSGEVGSVEISFTVN